MGQDWEWNGVNLTRQGFTVQYLGMSLNTPPVRGDNITVPHKTGRLHVAKWADQRIVSLAMWVKDIPIDGSGTVNEASLLSNLDTLRQIFADPGQHTLKHTFGSVTRLAQAEVVNQVTFEPFGTAPYYRFVVEFLMADPRWYAESATTSGTVTITGSPQNIALTNAGTYPVDDAIITIEGAITNPKFTVNANYMEYTGAVANGDTLVIDCGAYSALLGTVDVSGNISHTGGVEWLTLDPGVNTLTITASVIGTGILDKPTVQVSFTAPFV